MEWFMPRLFGFICARGLYPMLFCDFFTDCWRGATFQTKKRAHKKSRCCGCLRRQEQHDVHEAAVKKQELEEKGQELDEFEKEVSSQCEINMDRMVFWKILDNT